MKIAIVGSGISGLLAAGYFKSLSPDIFEVKPAASQNHFAVMRVRDENVGKILGTNATKVTVDKAVYSDGMLKQSASIKDNNLYSLKVDGRLSPRSIFDAARVDRYIIDWSAINFPIKYGYRFCVLDNECAFKSENATIKASDYDAIISTIPLPEMAKIIGADLGENYPSREIYVYRSQITHKSTVHQTIYFPETGTPIYRATIEGRQIIIEAMATVDKNSDIYKVMRCFGLAPCDFGEVRLHTQKYGKIFCTDDDERRNFILHLSEKYNIFSAGRFAIWRQIRTDDLISDLEKISKMLHMSAIKRKYERTKYESGTN